MVYLDVSVPQVPFHTLWIGVWMTGFCPAGFPHSEICGSMGICPSPQLIAAYHVFHRLLVPRHPPCALLCLTCLGFFIPPLPSVAALQVCYILERRANGKEPKPRDLSCGVVDCKSDHRVRKGPLKLGEWFWESQPERVKAPYPKMEGSCRIQSMARHEKPCQKQGGPPPKAKYYLVTDRA